jgi:hypothetical protein
VDVLGEISIGGTTAMQKIKTIIKVDGGLSLKKFQFTQAGTKNYLNFNMLSVSRS